MIYIYAVIYFNAFMLLIFKIAYLSFASPFEPGCEESSKWTQCCCKNADEQPMHPNKRNHLNTVFRCNLQTRKVQTIEQNYI